MLANIFRLVVAASIAAVVHAQPASQLRLEQNEKLGFIHIAVRPGFVSPANLTVEEGLYQFVVFDPQLIATALNIDLEDERGLSARQATTRAKGPRVAYRQRLTPGRYRLKIGTRSEWILQLTVSAKRQVGVL